VSCKKKKTVPATIIPKALPHIEQEIIIPTKCTYLPDERQKWDTYALNKINMVIHSITAFTLPLIPLARINSHNTIVLTTNPSTTASAYAVHMPITHDAIPTHKPTSGNTNSRWIKFLVHNIPTGTPEATIKEIIKLTYLTIKLMQEPHWLVPTERRLNKQASTIVISLQGTLTLTNLGTNTLFIGNQRCYITEYFSWTPISQCCNCYGYGYHTKLCNAEKPTSGICAQQHNTKDHLCAIPTCCASNSCTYPPMKCAACSVPHKASDLLYPECIRCLSGFRHTGPAPEQDESMEPTL
jgi:hypothetical protein